MSTSRRTFIRSAIAATMGAGAPACAVHGRPSGHTGTRIVSPTLAVVGPELEKGFAAQGRVRVLRQDGTDPRTGLVAPAALSEAGDAQTFFGPPSLVPLDAHMRLENLNPNVLLPGAFDAFTLAGAVYGLPLTYQAMWILHDKTIFAGANLPSPPLTWSLSTFASFARTLNATAAASAQFAGILDATWTNMRLLMSFIRQAGGTVAGATAVEGVDRAALSGLRALVDLLRSVRVDWLPFSNGVALGFRPPMYGGTLEGVQAVLKKEGWQGWSGFPQYASRPLTPIRQSVLVASQAATDAEVALLVRFTRWLYEPDQQRLLAAAAIPPMAVDPAVQAWWRQSTAVEATGQTAVVGIDHLVNPLAGLPLHVRNDARLGKAVRNAATKTQDLTAALGAQGITVM